MDLKQAFESKLEELAEDDTYKDMFLLCYQLESEDPEVMPIHESTNYENWLDLKHNPGSVVRYIYKRIGAPHEKDMTEPKFYTTKNQEVNPMALLSREHYSNNS